MEKKFVSKLFAITLLLSTPLIVASEDGNGSDSQWTDVVDRAAEQALQNVNNTNTVTTNATHTTDETTFPVVEPAVGTAGTVVTNEIAQQISTEVAPQVGRLQRVLNILKQFGVDRTQEGKNAVVFLSDILRNPRAHKLALAIAAESALPAKALFAYSRNVASKDNDASWKRWFENAAVSGAFFAFNAWLTAYTIKNAAALKNPRQKAQFAKEVIAVAAKLGIHWKLSIPYVKSFFARWNKNTK